MRVEALPAQLSDIDLLAPRMRASDRAEVMASHGHTPRQALEYSLATSTYAWTGWVGDQPVCMFGVTPISVLGGQGSPWLLGSDELCRWPKTFLRRCRPCVAAMLSVYPLLDNLVHDDNVVSKKWLRWLGFKLAPTAVELPGGKFRHFSMRGAGNV